MWQLLKCQANLFLIFLCDLVVPNYHRGGAFSTSSKHKLFQFASVCLSHHCADHSACAMPTRLCCLLLVCRQSLKKWWRRSMPASTAKTRTRAARAKGPLPNRAPHRWPRSPKRKSKNSLFAVKALVMSQCEGGPGRESMIPPLCLKHLYFPVLCTFVFVFCFLQPLICLCGINLFRGTLCTGRFYCTALQHCSYIYLDCWHRQGMQGLPQKPALWSSPSHFAGLTTALSPYKVFHSTYRKVQCLSSL